MSVGAETPRKKTKMIKGAAATYSEVLKCTDNLIDRHTDRIWNLQTPQISLVKIRMADSFLQNSRFSKFALNSAFTIVAFIQPSFNFLSSHLSAVI